MKRQQRLVREDSTMRNSNRIQEDNFISKFSYQLKNLNQLKNMEQKILIQCEEFGNKRGQKHRIIEQKKKQKGYSKGNKKQEYYILEDEKQQTSQIENEKKRIQKLAQNLSLGYKECSKQFTNPKKVNNIFNQSQKSNLNNEISKQQIFYSYQNIKALIYAQIIHKIAEFPKIESLREKSLVDQIYQILLKYPKNHARAILSVKQQLDKLFIKGIQSSDLVYNQQRIRQTQKQNKIIFHPTCIVSGQIFRQLILEKDYRFCISYGYKGIAKTFTYYFYQMLSNLFLQEIVQKQLNILENLCKKFNIYTIPKLFYWNMNIQYNNSYQDIKQIFLEQCKEIPFQKMNEIQKICINQKNKEGYLFQFLKQVCLFYKQLSIETYLIIDQINQIAQVFMEHQIMEKQKQLNSKIQQKHKLAKSLNQKIVLITDSSIFNCVIYNSPINSQILFNQNDFSLKQNQKFSLNVKKNLHLLPQQQHSQSQCFQFRILYPEIIKLQTSVWSITDMFMFELKNIIKIENSATIKQLRKLIFDLVIRDHGRTIFTCLSIRKEIYQHKNLLLLIRSQHQQIISQIQQIIKDIKINQKRQLKYSYQKFFGNIKEKKQRLNAKAILLDSIIQKRSQKIKQKDKSKLLNKIMSQEAKQIMIQLFQSQISLNWKKKIIFQHLDRNLFISFKKSIEFQSYLINLIAYLKCQYQNNLLRNQEYIEQRKYINQFTQNTTNELFSKNKNNSEGFSFILFEEIIEFIQQQVSEFYQLDKEQTQKILNHFCPFCPKNRRIAYGIFLEKAFIDYLQKERVRLNNILFFQNESPEGSIIMEGLPRLLKRSNNFVKYKNQDHIKEQNKKFLLQFLVSNTRSYLFRLVQKTSKAIDFALLKSKIFSGIQYYQVHFFKITLRTVEQQLQNKINFFLEAYQQLEKELNQMKKNCIKDKKQFNFEINYWIMGDSLNFKKIQELAFQANVKIILRRSSYLNKVIPLNFTQLDIQKKNQSNYVGNLLRILQEELKNTSGFQRQ